MSASQIECIGRDEFDAAWLMREHPPRFALDRKRMLFERIAAPIEGELRISQWTGRLPELAPPAADTQIEVVRRFYDYPTDAPGLIRWHVNFADSHLFGAYAGGLLAQDEQQVLEHPVLGALREALVARGTVDGRVTARTRDRASGRPTPVLVLGAARSLVLDTEGGLYGNAFRSADPEAIVAATTFLDPPTASSIVAMEAPQGGLGTYDRATIVDILATAYIAFAACVAESSPADATIHTGGWGTGAYGGDPTIMLLLQMCAARLAGVPRLVIHTRSAADALAEALRVLDELPWDGRTDALVDAVAARGYRWGVSNGT